MVIQTTFRIMAQRNHLSRFVSRCTILHAKYSAKCSIVQPVFAVGAPGTRWWGRCSAAAARAAARRHWPRHRRHHCRRRRRRRRPMPARAAGTVERASVVQADKQLGVSAGGGRGRGHMVCASVGERRFAITGALKHYSMAAALPARNDKRPCNLQPQFIITVFGVRDIQR
jgi:hypothetical protein